MKPWLVLAVLASLSACDNRKRVGPDPPYTGPSGAGPANPNRAALQPVLDKHARMVKAKRAAAIAVAADALAAPPVTRPEPLAKPLASPPVVPEKQFRTGGDTMF